jgi:hypothetical protein
MPEEFAMARKKLVRNVCGALLLGAALAGSALAQTPEPPVSNAPRADDRYRFSPVDGGVLRLDARTGQVSFCRARAGSWACETAADDRAALEAEIGRLQGRINALEKQTAERKPENTLKLPTDAEVDQVMTFFERVMKRFRTMVESLKREFDAPPT